MTRATPLVLEGQAKQDAMDSICAQIADGTPLRVICRQGGMPKWRTVYDWINADPEFAKSMEAARVLGAHAIAEDTIAIMDEPPQRIKTDHGDRVDPGHVQWQKNRVDQRMKLLAKWHPDPYGDKITAEHVGKDGGPIQTSHTLDVSNLTDEQLRAISSIPLNRE